MATGLSTAAERRASSQQAADLVLAALALLCACAVGYASLRHTGSMAFPIDDGYIYSNYVLAAAGGHPFTYNPGETSGGITSPGWYLLCTLGYLLLAPFHGLLGGLAPQIVRDDPALAQQAGHLFLAAYLPGALCLAAAAIGTRRLADVSLPAARPGREALRSAFCWLLGAVAAADVGLVWGAMSGLEVALSAALVTWAVYWLLREAPSGRLRWSLLFAALLPWARPDLLAVAAAGFGWLLLLGVLRVLAGGRATGLKCALLYLAATVAGVATMALFYFAGWGRPLPSSYYAKVGGLRLGARFFSAAQEMVIAGRYLPFAGAALAMLGGIAGMVNGGARREQNKTGTTPGWSRWASLLLLLTFVGYVASIMAALPWFGQEDRYLLPIHPAAIVLLGLLAWAGLSHLPVEALRARPGLVEVVGGGLGIVLLGVCYIWATENYAVEVRNIADAHIKPALWLAANTPLDALVVSEPIGAVRLYSGRRTIDLVGLTTPATLGTYGDWPKAWPAIKAADGSYLLYYPNWFDGRRPPPWAVERARFDIPDNRIAGDRVIAVYELRWDLYALP